MKRLNQRGFGLPVVLIILVVVATVGFVAFRTAKKNNASPITRSPAITKPSNNDCGGDTDCFYQAFTNGCLQKTVQTSQTTIEGDPIFTKAKIASSGQGCLLEVVVDGSHDKFGDGKINTYTCKRLAKAENQLLTASECTGSTQITSVNI